MKHVVAIISENGTTGLNESINSAVAQSDVDLSVLMISNANDAANIIMGKHAESNPMFVHAKYSEKQRITILWNMAAAFCVDNGYDFVTVLDQRYSLSLQSLSNIESIMKANPNVGVVAPCTNSYVRQDYQSLRRYMKYHSSDIEAISAHIKRNSIKSYEVQYVDSFCFTLNHEAIIGLSNDDGLVFGHDEPLRAFDMFQKELHEVGLMSVVSTHSYAHYNGIPK